MGPAKKGVINELEKVQNLYLRFLSYRKNNPMSFRDHDYEFIRNLTNLGTLQNTRAKNDLKFLFKLANNNCNELCSIIEFNSTSYKTEHPSMIFNYDKKKNPCDIINRIYYLANLNKNWLKFKELSLIQFNTQINKNVIINSNEII